MILITEINDQVLLTLSDKNITQMSSVSLHDFISLHETRYHFFMVANLEDVGEIIGISVLTSPLPQRS